MANVLARRRGEDGGAGTRPIDVRNGVAAERATFRARNSGAPRSGSQCHDFGNARRYKMCSEGSQFPIAKRLPEHANVER